MNVPKPEKEKNWLYICLDASDGTIETEILSKNGFCTVKMLGATSSSDLDKNMLREADVVAVWHTIQLDDRLLGQFKKPPKAIIRMGVGYDNVDIKAAGRLGIPVCNIPDYGTEEVADHALSLILGLYRGVFSSMERIQKKEKIQGADGIALAAGRSVRRIRGSTLGLVGLGRIGTAVAVRAKAFGFEVSFYDPFKDDGYEKALGIKRYDTIEELFQKSDCISLHCNCMPENTNMVNRKLLEMMPGGSMLVNTARGELVDEIALADVLRSGKLAAAALDVHWNEPFIKGKNPIGADDIPNLYCTPHMGWYSPESRLEMRQKGAITARRALQGLPLSNVVNKELLIESKSLMLKDTFNYM